MIVATTVTLATIEYRKGGRGLSDATVMNGNFYAVRTEKTEFREEIAFFSGVESLHESS
jgi:hypothetical protein